MAMTAENSERIIFRYSLKVRLYPIILSIALLFPLFCPVGTYATQYLSKNMPLPPAILPLLLLFVVLWGIMLLIAVNFSPEIIADKDGLQVQFLWYRLHLLWQDIVEIKPSFFNLSNHTTIWIVRTRKLSPFHRLYGLMYSFTFLPSFIIHYEIENREALIEMIEKRCFV